MTEVEKLWRAVPTDRLELNAAIVKALALAELDTLGAVSDFGDLTKIDGIAKPSAKAVTNAIAALKEDLKDVPGDPPAEPGDDQPPKNETPPSESENQAPKKDGAKESPKRETPPDDTQSPDEEPDDIDPSGVTDEELIDQSDEEARSSLLLAIERTAQKEDENGLYRMYAAGQKANDIEIMQIVKREIDRRFEQKRRKQIEFTLPLRYSGFNREGYGVSKNNVPRNIHRTRISHTAGVALAKLKIAMMETGVKLASGRKVTKTAHVVEKILELAYEEISTTSSK